MSLKKAEKEGNKRSNKIAVHELKALELMYTARYMAELFDEHKEFCSRYVHSTSKGHEAIQLAAAFHLTERDYAALYYRDESILLGLGFTPYELMLQLMAKKEDPFSGGRTYYSHPSVRREGFPTIPHQSSATGMQAIPATGMAHAIEFLDGLEGVSKDAFVLCSIGDGAMTEGEVSEAMQMAALKQLPILYLVQDNEWGISASGDEMRSMDAYEFAKGFKGIRPFRVDGSDFNACYAIIGDIIASIRKGKGPALLHATCPLLGHHTSGVRKEWYRTPEDIGKHEATDPLKALLSHLRSEGLKQGEIDLIRARAEKKVGDEFDRARNSEDPLTEEFNTHEFAPTPIRLESGVRVPDSTEKVMMVDAALHSISEILEKHQNSLFYGQDVGGRLGGVFREAATLAEKYGSNRVFNTPIQEAYIVGSTAGMTAVGALPIVEIQFADYIWPALNQLVEELSKSCYLSNGQFPIQSLIRVPIGAYGGGGPYHSGSIESTLLNIRGIKVVFPSDAADMKGLMKAAFYDPNPVVMLEHKGLYWSKVPGTERAKTIEPDRDYILPLGVAAIKKEASEQLVQNGESAVIITYGMGVHWAWNVDADLLDSIEIVDLRTLNPIDWDLIQERVRVHSKVLVLTEEPLMNSFAESLAGRIGAQCFESLDAPVMTMGSADLPAIPLNRDLEAMMLPNPEKVSKKVRELLSY